MVRRVLAGLCVGFMCIFGASCGQSYKLQSIAVTPSTGYSFSDLGDTGALVVVASFSNTKSSVVTANSTYQVGVSTAPANAAPLGVITVDNSGLVVNSSTLVACTYDPVTSQAYPYPVTVSYSNNGVTATKIVPINVSTAPGCNGK